MFITYQTYLFVKTKIYISNSIHTLHSYDVKKIYNVKLSEMYWDQIEGLKILDILMFINETVLPANFN